MVPGPGARGALPPPQGQVGHAEAQASNQPAYCEPAFQHYLVFEEKIKCSWKGVS